jgi:hypothetical protein
MRYEKSLLPRSRSSSSRRRRSSDHNSKWYLSTRENIEKGRTDLAALTLDTAALTPDQARPSEVCQVYDGRTLVEAAEARFVISHD